MSTAKHLWEHKHPYYCEPGNFYERGLNQRFESWAEFAIPVTYKHDENGQLIVSGTALYNGDPDLNLLFRWDWRAWHLEFPEDYQDGQEQHELFLFFMMQRKGFNRSVMIDVNPEDEPEVREWLEGRAKTVRALWGPFVAPAS